MYLHHGGVRVGQAKALPIVDNVDVSSRYGREMTDGVRVGCGVRVRRR